MGRRTTVGPNSEAELTKQAHPEKRQVPPLGHPLAIPPSDRLFRSGVLATGLGLEMVLPNGDAYESGLFGVSHMSIE